MWKSPQEYLTSIDDKHVTSASQETCVYNFVYLYIEVQITIKFVLIFAMIKKDCWAMEVWALSTP